MKKLIFFLITGIFSVISCEPEIEEPIIKYGSIQGFVNIGSTNEPLAGLEAILSDDQSRITGSNGTFLFEKVEEGDHTISMYQASKFLEAKQVHVTANHTTPVFFIFEYEKPSKQELPDLSLVDISSEGVGWDYWVVGKEEYFYIDEENSKPKSLFYRSFKNNKSYGFFFNSEGLPEKVVTQGYIYLFDNFNGKKVDLGIISPEGVIQIVREIQTDFNWPSFFPSTKSTQSKAGFIRWTGRIIGAVPCVASGAAAFVTGGAAIPLAAISCGSYFLSLSANLSEDAGITNGFTEFYSKYNMPIAALNCTVNPADCAISLAQKGLEEYADYVEELEERWRDIDMTEAALYAGYGDVQVTLTWDNEADLDLHVIDPYEEEIYFRHKNSESGGVLDYDDTNGYGPENVYWPRNGAPSGLYQVSVHHYPAEIKPHSSNYTVLINAFGSTKKYTGGITFDQEIIIAFFDENELYSHDSKSTRNSSFNHLKITRESK